MLSIPAVFALFFLSFAPLWLSVLLIDIRSICCGTDPHIMTEMISIVLIIAGSILSGIISFSALKRRGLENTCCFTVVSQREEKTVTAEFLLSYILPLFAFNYTKWDEVLLFLMFFLTLAGLCLRHNRFTAGVVLELTGYRFYRCKLKPEQGDTVERMVVTKTPMAYKIGTKCMLRQLNNDCMLDETITKGKS